MEHVSFVILHYCSVDLTVQCVESIINNISYEKYTIVIVDNGSPNGSGIFLKKKYETDNRVVVIFAGDNIGFAKGNNIGYKYAKEVLNSKFIVITNSDTIFEQKDFVVKLRKLYVEKGFEIIGPDIITPSGIHQNPHREVPMTFFQARKMLLIKSIFLYYFRIKKFMHIGNRINILEKWFENKDKKTQQNIPYKLEKRNIVLLGACLIFSPSYVEKEAEAFYPGTFMYGEEDILTYLSLKKGYRLLYSPEIQLYHLNGEVTKKRYEDNLDKNIFTYTYIVKGCKILLRMMKDGGVV